MRKSDYSIKGAILYKIMIDKINILFQAKKKVLDIGCGSMTLLENMNVDQKYGIDISISHIKESRQRYHDAKYKIASVLNMPFKDKYFESAFSINVFHYISLKKCLPEIKRVLKNDGEFIAVVMNKNFPITVDHTLFFNVLRHKELRFSWQDGDYSPIMCSEKELRKIFGSFGFEVLHIEAFDSYLINIHDIFSTVILRATPEFLQEYLFYFFANIAELLYIVETNFLKLTKSRSYFVYTRNKVALRSSAM